MSFKINWKLEPYLLTLDSERTISLIKFRTGNHRFPIETGRYKNIPIKDRNCRFCNILGDEFHYLLECNQFHSSRIKYIDKYFYTRPNMLKFQQLMNCKAMKQMSNLTFFVSIIVKNVN